MSGGLLQHSCVKVLPLSVLHRSNVHIPVFFHGSERRWEENFSKVEHASYQVMYATSL